MPRQPDLGAELIPAALLHDGRTCGIAAQAIIAQGAGNAPIIVQGLVSAGFKPDGMKST